MVRRMICLWALNGLTTIPIDVMYLILLTDGKHVQTSSLYVFSVKAHEYIIHVFVCMYVYVLVCMCMYVYVFVRMYVYVCVCKYVYVCMYVCTYVCTYICMYVCMYVCERSSNKGVQNITVSLMRTIRNVGPSTKMMDMKMKDVNVTFAGKE